ncbi:MAG: hypothetical protein D3909_17435 [Candidatus Electrothrix sp. ATG1]|nr:hypothetical protein [Candidatus Electrothrix sp. ATG1]
MKIINISELYLKSERVENIRRMFLRIVAFYMDTERPLIIITGYVQITGDGQDSEQVRMAVEILERHQFGFIRMTGDVLGKSSFYSGCEGV